MLKLSTRGFFLINLRGPRQKWCLSLHVAVDNFIFITLSPLGPDLLSMDFLSKWRLVMTQTWVQTCQEGRQWKHGLFITSQQSGAGEKMIKFKLFAEFILFYFLCCRLQDCRVMDIDISGVGEYNPSSLSVTPETVALRCHHTQTFTLRSH